jgi:hypothetical protein
MFVLKNKKTENLNEFFLEKTTLYMKIDTPQKTERGEKTLCAVKKNLTGKK